MLTVHTVSVKQLDFYDLILFLTKGHGLQLDNRPIFVSMALKPEDVREKQVENKTVKEDKIKKDARNLFLSREGLVREGTQAAIGVSKEDLQIRTQGEKRKKVSFSKVQIV